MIKEEYGRIYRNYDRCMKAFEDIIQVCQTQQNYTIANIIEECINSLEKTPVEIKEK